MGKREEQIAKSIIYVIINTDENGKPIQRQTVLSRILSIFNLYWLTFQLVREDLFRGLREFWAIKSSDYKDSFTPASAASRNKKKAPLLQPLGDMGYSGSTFFRTADGAYLVKSVPRSFENKFFKNDMLLPYADHMRANPGSLLVRITDFLECTRGSLGTLFGLAPTHHIVMENILYGQDEKKTSSSTSVGPSGNGQDGEGEQPKKKWESWDLKPTSYFFPERDIAGGKLTSEATKSKLADEFEGKLYLTLDQAEDFKAQLQKDTKFLADRNAVDYSLFLVRISVDTDGDNADGQEAGSADLLTRVQTDGKTPVIPPAQPPFAPPGPPSWCTGISSSNGKEIYRAAVLDFFWAKHTVHAKAMTGLINTYNLVDEQGPMSVTAEADEYRQRFMKMCLDMIEVDGRMWNFEGAEATGPEASSGS
ncbi:SAICAR synthase-like protein [Apiospora arundinis]